MKVKKLLLHQEKKTLLNTKLIPRAESVQRSGDNKRSSRSEPDSKQSQAAFILLPWESVDKGQCSFQLTLPECKVTNP